MKFNIKMPINLISFYQKELEAVKDNLQHDNDTNKLTLEDKLFESVVSSSLETERVIYLGY